MDIFTNYKEAFGSCGIMVYHKIQYMGNTTIRCSGLAVQFLFYYSMLIGILVVVD